MANPIYAKTYRTFLGVDFSKDASMVDEKRSPDAENIVSDLDGFPEKRVGWREISEFDGKINGIFPFSGEEGDCLVVHAGSKMYKLSGDARTEIYDGCADNRSTGKSFKGKLCILTGEEFLVFDGSRCCKVSEFPEVYAPITHIQRKATSCDYYDLSLSTEFVNWWEDGIFPYEDQPGMIPESAEVNLVSGKRKNTFEVIKNNWNFFFFVLDAKIDPGSRVVMRYMPTGEVLFDVTFSSDDKYQNGYYRITDEDGEDGLNRELLKEYNVYTGPSKTYVWLGNSEKNNCGFVACIPNFTALRGYIYTPGVDDFSIEFSHSVEGYGERIEKCRIMDVFENRLFFSGNPDYPNVDWYSAVNDPMFVPDINYTEIGLESSEIMGYLRTGSEQAILKSDGDGATIYMRSYQSLSDGVIFPIKQGTGGLGAVSRSAMTTFLDDPVYLTRNGVYAIAMQDISNERALNLRSTRINAKLLLEKDISEAVMCEWEGYLLLSVGGKCFVADAAQKSTSGNKTGTFEYEWYYWTNIPARVMTAIGETLLFGTEDGKLCRFNNDMVNARGEIQSAAYSDNGNAIRARWATPLSDDGDFMRLKTMVKTGSGVFLKAYNRSGVKVSVWTDSGGKEEVLEKSAGIFSFEDVDFSNFTFNTSPYIVVPFNTRVKKYKAIQLICENNKLNEAFGIGGIVRKFFYGKTNK